MTTPLLAIGNKNYSSWSLRAWLAAKHTGMTFEEVVIPLDHPDTQKKIAAYSPSGRVPALHDGDVIVWDSLAIAEHLAAVFPEARLWPEDRAARGVARSVSAEMHSSFAALRAHMPMNVRSKFPGYGRTPASLHDIERVRAIWTQCRARFGADGPFLFGPFSIADAMYAPVVFRFRTYAVELDTQLSEYIETMLTHPAMQEWARAAEAEEWTIGEDEYPAIRA